ncbi:hypothetical protein WA026_012839 [Henosepilachna vigintioctopunctata]|uniref:Serine-threonine/tyrosine-protein kinase catalytic domain-containing protein n=1 Tax=Henosepilachna vigintioctopunctata TaxID=420089 RepID=A0AAW1TMD8_9CUCU
MISSTTNFTVDVYMMLQCWMLKEERQPKFKELVDIFLEMARDPRRYLAIPRDKLMRLQSSQSLQALLACRAPPHANGLPSTSPVPSYSNRLCLWLSQFTSNYKSKVHNINYMSFRSSGVSVKSNNDVGFDEYDSSSRAQAQVGTSKLEPPSMKTT